MASVINLHWWTMSRLTFPDRLFIFEEKETDIRMTIKNMSRTHLADRRQEQKLGGGPSHENVCG